MSTSCSGIHLTMMMIFTSWKTLEAARVPGDDDTGADDDYAAADVTGDDGADDDTADDDADGADDDTGDDDAAADDFRELENIGGSEGPRRTNQQLVAPLLPLPPLHNS